MQEDFYIFGGTFDPIHEGHVGVIRELLALNKNVIIATTESNPFKPPPQYSYEQRLEMIKKVLRYEKLDFSIQLPTRLLILDYKYRYVCEFVNWWRERHNGNLFWVIGADLVDQVKKWKNWEALNLQIYVAKNYADNLHSTDVRMQKRPIHPALKL